MLVTLQVITARTTDAGHSSSDYSQDNWCWSLFKWLQPGQLRLVTLYVLVAWKTDDGHVFSTCMSQCCEHTHDVMEILSCAVTRVLLVMDTAICRKTMTYIRQVSMWLSINHKLSTVTGYNHHISYKDIGHKVHKLCIKHSSPQRRKLLFNCVYSHHEMLVCAVSSHSLPQSLAPGSFWLHQERVHFWFWF